MKTKRDKHTFDALDIERKCYQLLSCFFASRKVHAFLGKDPEKGVAVMAEVHEREVIKDLLITIAIRLRIIDDIMHRHGRTHIFMGDNLGEIQIQNSKMKSPFAIREVCNKIIHADRIGFVTQTRHSVTYLAPVIRLAGVQNKKKWNAQIDVPLFVQTAFLMAFEYDNDWDLQ